MMGIYDLVRLIPSKGNEEVRENYHRAVKHRCKVIKQKDHVEESILRYALEFFRDYEKKGQIYSNREVMQSFMAFLNQNVMEGGE